MKKKMSARVISDKQLGKVVRIECPLMVGWDKYGTLLGVTCDVPKGATSYQRGLINSMLDIINSSIDLYNEMEEYVENRNVTPIPDYIKKAFTDDTETV